MNSQISNNSSQVNFSSGKNQLISSIRNVGGTTNNNNNSSNISAKPVSISMNNPSSNSANKFAFGVNKLGLTNATLNIFKSKNIN